MRHFQGLRFQLATAMVGCVVATVVMAFVAAMALMAMDEASGAALAPAGALDGWILLGVALFAIALGGAIALLLAGRLGRQLDQVSNAATRVAHGDLDARALLLKGAVGETVRLAENFNSMASTLERFEQQAVASSAAIAHELRTPLAILLGRLQGMQEGIFGAERADIAILIRHVESLGKIVDDLALVSLASAGRLDVHPVDIDIAAEVATLVDDLRPRLESSGLSLDLSLPRTMARADAKRIRQATLALIENVVRHAGTGGSIGIEVRRAGATAIIDILDRGPGIGVGEQRLLFLPFWRRDVSRSREAGGSGLGLSVVASIVGAHAGQIAAFNREGGGAVFQITLPAPPERNRGSL